MKSEEQINKRIEYLKTQAKKYKIGSTDHFNLMIAMNNLMWTLEDGE